MHPRERVLETIRLHEIQDLALPVDIHAQAVRLGIIAGAHPTTTTTTTSLQGESKDGTKDKFRNFQRTRCIPMVE